jgi:hypothetical protein
VCGRRYGELQWRALEVYRCLGSREIGPIVRNWPVAKMVEVRRCLCGALIAVRRESL